MENEPQNQDTRVRKIVGDMLDEFFTTAAGDAVIRDAPVRLTCGRTGGALYVRPSVVLAVRPTHFFNKPNYTAPSGLVSPKAQLILGTGGSGDGYGLSVCETADEAVALLWPGEVDLLGAKPPPQEPAEETGG